MEAPAAAFAFGAKKDERPEALSRRPGSEQMKPGNVLGTSATCSGTSPLSVHVVHAETESSSIPVQSPSTRASNDSPSESQDEDDNVVEELMNREGGEEENVGVETGFGIAQVDTVASVIVGPQEPTTAFVISQDVVPDHAFTRHDDSTQDGPHGNVHMDTPIASMCKVTDADISMDVPTTTVKPLDYQGGTGNEPILQSGVEDLEASNILSKNNSARDRSTVHIDNGPLPDPTGGPAPDCSQEVCMRAADGAAAGGGLPSPPGFMPVTGPGFGVSLEEEDVDPRTGRQQSGAASPPLVPSREERRSIPPSPKSTHVVDEEIVRFMEITLDGMAQVQDGLRGVFAIQGRRRAVQKRKMAVGDKYTK